MDKKTYIEQRNYQSKVRALCIALINRHADIEIKITSKRSKLTLPFLKINKIFFTSEDVIDLNKLIKKRTSDLAELDVEHKITQQSALYRKKKNSYKESINFVVDLLIELGYCITFFETSGRNKTLKVDTITSIQKDGETFTSSQLEKIGQTLCINLVERIGSNQSLLLRKNDFKLISMTYA
ncbi:hypothetical protein ENUP19_0126G0068 [Entamoeba nuttalli]|uniref:TATA-binding protein-associated phosphoprotein n=1 Tax=Entamoeba nuttalli TaxID=412467 RepID=A0ABQ0DJG7_9EUKA